MSAVEQFHSFLAIAESDSKLREQMRSLLRYGTDSEVLKEVCEQGKRLGFVFSVGTIADDEEGHLRLINLGQKPNRSLSSDNSQETSIHQFFRKCIEDEFIYRNVTRLIESGGAYSAWELSHLASREGFDISSEEFAEFMKSTPAIKYKFPQWLNQILFPGYLERLLSGASDWNQWRSSNQIETANFDGLRIPDDPWVEVDLSGADLSNVSFKGTKFGKVNLSGANLSGAVLCSADLRKCRLDGAIFTDADLCNANLQSCDLSNSNLIHAKLCEANLERAKLVCCKFIDSDLSKAILRSADLSYSDLSGAKLDGAQLDIAMIYQVKLTNARLVNANLGRSNLGGSSMSGTDFSQVHAWESKFNDCDLSNTIFAGAMLDYATLHNANLSNANLSNASVRSLKLRGANTSGMSLAGARHADEIWWYD